MSFSSVNYDNLDDALEEVARIQRQVVLETLELPYTSTKVRAGLDFDSMIGPQLPLGEKLDLLSFLRAQGEVRLDVRARASQYGAEQRREDVYAKMRVERLLKDSFEVVLIAGEESDEAEWARVLHAIAGTLIAIVDPCDGTTNVRAVRTAFSVNTGLYLALGAGRMKHLGSVSTSATQESLVFNALKKSTRMQSPLGTWLTISEAQSGAESVPGSFVTVAARAEARAELAGLFDPDASFALEPQSYGGHPSYDPGLTIYTAGGAPALISFPLGGAEYLHVPHAQTVYDAFPLIGALAAGGCTYFLAETMEPASLEDALTWFNTVTGPQGTDPRPVPPGLLVRDGTRQESTAAVLREVHEVWRASRVASEKSADS